MLCAGWWLDVLAAFDVDPKLVWGDSWLGQFEEASSALELIENGGGRGFSGREKEEIKEKKKKKEKREKKKM